MSDNLLDFVGTGVTKASAAKKTVPKGSYVTSKKPVAKPTSKTRKKTRK